MDLGDSGNAMTSPDPSSMQRCSCRRGGDTHLDGQRHACILGGGMCVVWQIQFVF